MPDRGNTRSAGWRHLHNATAGGTEALGLDLRGTQDKASTFATQQASYVFGLGNDAGRISTVTRNGTQLAVPDAYSFGEMWELRFSFAESGNSQRQGIYLQVDTTVANSSTVRAIEAGARARANVAVGTIQGAYVTAYTGSATDANVATLIGASIEAQMSSTYTGTVTDLVGLQVKLQTEDGATVTGGAGIRIVNEDVTGGKRVTSAIDIDSTSAEKFRYLIDSTGAETTNGSGNEVVLMAFKGSNGTTYYLIHDTDAATAVSVVTVDPTS